MVGAIRSSGHGLVFRARSTQRIQSRYSATAGSRHSFTTSPGPTDTLQPVQFLPSWDPYVFLRDAYQPALPRRLPRSAPNLPPATQKWFIHDTSIPCTADGNGNGNGNWPSISSELNPSFWAEHASTIVPLELTSTPSTPSIDDASDQDASFVRADAPLKLLLDHLSQRASAKSLSRHQNLYLAQCELSTLPTPVQADLPLPSPLLSPNQVDIYASSLWLGRPPTYTPLHRDPNPNLFVQLAGRKVVRLLPPDVGALIYRDLQARLGRAHSDRIRGEEMMEGPERRSLHDAIWSDLPPPVSPTSNSAEAPAAVDTEIPPYGHVMREFALEATLALGDAIFVPAGWWHSVKGIGSGVTASANWWFRFRRAL